jgi:NADH-quinone oxidoreductase subunit F/NADP-reducing hydrogenase subunit HndC
VAHIQDKRCPAGVCAALLVYRIKPELCRGCTACTKVCPVGAISGTRKEVHFIDPDKCIKCGACMERCPFGAIVRG